MHKTLHYLPDACTCHWKMYAQLKWACVVKCTCLNKFCVQNQDWMLLRSASPKRALNICWCCSFSIHFVVWLSHLGFVALLHCRKKQLINKSWFTIFKAYLRVKLNYGEKIEMKRQTLLRVLHDQWAWNFGYSVFVLSSFLCCWQKKMFQGYWNNYLAPIYILHLAQS